VASADQYPILAPPDPSIGHNSVIKWDTSGSSAGGIG
jgi:hypothetical protein